MANRKRAEALRELLKIQCRVFYALNREISKNMTELWKCES